MVGLSLLVAGAVSAVEPDAPTDVTSGEAPADEVSASGDLSAFTPQLAPDDPARQRMPFYVLLDRAIGTTARPVAFNWRASPVQFAAIGGLVAELNTFNTARGGALMRLPSQRTVFELGVAYVRVTDSQGSNAIALTPYRQDGRPSRLEVDAQLGYALAEGVITSAPRWMPSMQMVVNAYGGVRYAVYPTGFRGLRPGQVGVAIVSPELSIAEIDNLESARLAAMSVDPSRYWLQAGLGQDLYFKQGFFISPRVMFTVPLLATVTGSRLLLAPDFSLAIGFAL